jgi:hypothetical protein
MAFGLQTLSPRDISLSFIGTIISMFAKGTFVEITFDVDAFTDEVGATGDVARYLSADERGTIKFTLMRNSPSNAVLSALAVTDRLTGAITGPAFVKDGRGTSIALSAQSWIKKIPDSSHATEPTTISWEIRCARLVNIVGGTNQ